jgi:UDP-N-acetyl-D-glucosamine dehydrogenase
MAKKQEVLIKKLENKTARIGVVGVGYVGLPLAVVFAEAGFNVVGVDPAEEKVAAINRGESYILDIDSARVENLLKKGKLTASVDYAVLKDVDAVSICVPTPLRKTGDPDLSFIVSATQSLAPFVHEGMVIVLESSTYPGTTREMVLRFICM